MPSQPHLFGAALAAALFGTVTFAAPTAHARPADDAAEDDDGKKGDDDADDDKGEDKADDDKAEDDDEGEKKAKKKKAKKDDDEDEAKDDEEGEEKKSDQIRLLDFMTFGVGFIGVAGGNFLDKPDDQTVNGAIRDPNYPGFAGPTLGFGPVIEFRFFDYVGIEMDILFTNDSGVADVDLTIGGNRTTHTIEISHSAVHLPLFVKGTIPGEIVTPMLFLGPEFVFPSDPVASAEPEIRTPFTTYGVQAPEDYIMFSFGLGMEFKLPIPKADIRIPIQLRGSFNPGVPNTRDERTTYIDGPAPREEFSTEWKFQATGIWGAAFHF